MNQITTIDVHFDPSAIEIVEAPIIIGPKGDTGAQGLQGISGAIGPVGPKGDIGPIGLTGPIGPIGAQGVQGVQGAQGAQGLTGAASTIPGPPGLQGIQGIQGPAGATGPPGGLGEAPIDGAQYARKNAAWTVVASGGGLDIPTADARYINVTGDTMTGPLVLPGNPAAALQAAPKQYVDSAISAIPPPVDISGKVSKTGDTMTGALTVNSNINCNGDVYAIRSNGPTGVLYLGNNAGARYLYYDGGSYNLAGAPLNCSAGTSSFGALTVNGGLTAQNWGGNAGLGLIFFGNSGARYLYWDGGNWTFNGGHVFSAAGRLWGTNDFAAPVAPNLAPYVTNGRLAYAGDQLTSSFNEPYGGGVVTGEGGGSARWRYMQLLTTGWFTIGYA
jgi:hypothetical protein